MQFTIFTGCYNSSIFIHRVFDSLRNQIYKNFEWIVIDDSSTDDTVKLIRLFMENNPEIDIKLIEKLKNQGVGLNRKEAVMLAQGDFFLNWDHDDEHKPNELQMFKEIWNELGNDKVANIFSFCENQEGKLLGHKFSKGNHISNYFNHYKEHFLNDKMIQEKQACTRIDVLRQFIDFKFPEGKKVFGDTLWAKIALDYDSIFLNEAFRVYYIEESNNHNMSNKTRTEMAQSVYIDKLIWVNHFIKSLKEEPLLQLRILFALDFYGFLSGKNIFEIVGKVNDYFYKFLILLLALPAKLLIFKMKLSNSGL